MVQAIASQTLRSAPDMHVARQTLAERINILSRAHDTVIQGGLGSSDHVLAGVGFVEGKPALVELCCFLRFALCRQRFGEFQQIDQRKTLGFCKLQQGWEERILGRAANRCIHCIQNLQAGLTAGGGLMAVID